MRVAVLSGKGGTGKTFIATNLASVAADAVYIDCDAEEPNGRIFLGGRETEIGDVEVSVPFFDPKKCVGCRACVESCAFNALAFITKVPLLFPNLCHSCGLCAMVCRTGAVSWVRRKAGQVILGGRGSLAVVTGILKPGEASSVPVVGAALEKGFSLGRRDAVIDCPPGTGCAVVHSAREADLCLAVAEPTAFGLHDLALVRELAQALGKRCCAVVNKETAAYKPLDDYCARNMIPILLRVPFSFEVADFCGNGVLATDKDPAFKRMFSCLWRKLEMIGGGK